MTSGRQAAGAGVRAPATGQQAGDTPSSRGAGQAAPPPGRRGVTFDPGCQRCPRLAHWLEDCRASHPGYHLAPVPPFGDAQPRLLVVGLAPGFHGANRTGRPFTGDHAGILLYRTLHELGLSSAAESVAASDGLQLHGVRISNAVKCVPPQNKPLPAEVRECNGYLAAELVSLAPPAVLALGRIAHEAVLRALGQRLADHPFAHAAEHALPNGTWLIDSFHCSRYNTQTRRLTEDMFRSVCARAKGLAGL
jgi:uracil-DNA glycosylase